MSYFEPHKEVLSPEQLTLMPGLIGATRLGYVLYLMANKLKVILQRVSAKDYLDIAAMVNAGIALDKGLAAASDVRSGVSTGRKLKSDDLF